MLGDWVKFSCESCAAAPQLQTMLGCFTKTERVVASYAGHDFVRCPITYQEPRAIVLVRMAQDKYLERTNKRLSLPAKRVAALEYIAFLLKVKEVS